MARLKGRLIPMYQQMHAGKVYRGGSTLRKHLRSIAQLVREMPPRTILDYGCGKGKQYTEDRMHDAWGGIMPTLFDPGVPGLDELPESTFDAVICTGVLEHIPGPEIAVTIERLAGYTTKWAFISIGCSPSKKLLPDGRSVHVTLKPEQWWLDKLRPAFSHARLEVEFIW